LPKGTDIWWEAPIQELVGWACVSHLSFCFEEI
jgi:hypothetical protein